MKTAWIVGVALLPLVACGPRPYIAPTPSATEKASAAVAKAVRDGNLDPMDEKLCAARSRGAYNPDLYYMRCVQAALH